MITLCKSMHYACIAICAITWTIPRAVEKPSETQTTGFFVTNGRLYDARGNEFIIRGVNNPHAWSDDYGRYYAYQALSQIATTGCNCVRIVWQTDRLSVKDLGNVIKKTVDLQMIPLVELHDVTGESSSYDLLRMADFWIRSDVRELIRRYEDYILINIANEWGDHSVGEDAWLSAYKDAVTKIRTAGINALLVVDAPGWGQSSWVLLNKGLSLLASDPQKNILFDLHMYGAFNNASDIGSVIKAARDKNLPLLIGEFGYNYNNGNNNLGCRIDADEVMKQCNMYQTGYCAWSWSGNNDQNKWLDMSSDWSAGSLTSWGKKVIDGRYGIRNTAQRASVFNTTARFLVGKERTAGGIASPPHRFVTMQGRVCGLKNAEGYRRLRSGTGVPVCLPVSVVIPVP
jgi:mannan endo-1,4-beta-mannosidase